MRGIRHYLKQINKYGVLFIMYRISYRKSGKEFSKIVGSILNLGNKIRDFFVFRNIDVLKLATYDGSNQAVHPDIDILTEDKMIFVCTPYPYNTEVYENPCVYTAMRTKDGKSINIKLREMLGNPIDKRHGSQAGEHMSDPAVLIFGGKIYVYYRDAELYDGIMWDMLYEQIFDATSFALLSKKLVRRSTNTYVSPTFLYDKGEVVCYAVHYAENDSELVISRKDEDEEQWGEVLVQPVEGELLNYYYVWHISIAYKEGRRKHNDDGMTELIGLFTMRSREDYDKYILVYAIYGDCKWVLEKEITLPEIFVKKGYTPYKSCFVPDSKQIIVSAYDRKKRWKNFMVEMI